MRHFIHVAWDASANNASMYMSHSECECQQYRHIYWSLVPKGLTLVDQISKNRLWIKNVLHWNPICYRQKNQRQDCTMYKMIRNTVHQCQT